jgi:type IV pilus assembly protein PilV
MTVWIATSNSIRQYGFTLIEVLVAALVLSIGLLGLAGLQAVSLKMNHGAYLRSQATNLAYEIADAMRANRGSSAAYAGTYATVSCVLDHSRTASGNTKTDDIADWRNRLACLLPSGSGTIAVLTGTQRATITVTWDESRYGATEPQSFTFSTEL